MPSTSDAMTEHHAMSASAAPQLLYWESSYEIVLRLLERYPTVDLDSLGLQDLYTMIVTLPDFGDDPALANDELLTEILREYYEEATNP
jgi:FeS assembly protein IscX